MRTVLILALSTSFSLAFAATDATKAAKSVKMPVAEIEKTARSEKNPTSKFHAMAALMKHYSSSTIPAAALGEVEKQAQDLLKSALENQGDFEYGNAVHHGNLVLGRIALRRGKVATAEDFLRRAGDPPSSTDLISRGPNMTLAKELLEKGRKDAVLSYLDQVAKFWEYSDYDPHSNLTLWKKEVSAGRIPDFRQNLTY